jgi:hypothetical protein
MGGEFETGGRRSVNCVCSMNDHTEGGPSSLGSSAVGSESVPGLGLTDTCAASGLPSQT